MLKYGQPFVMWGNIQASKIIGMSQAQNGTNEVLQFWCVSQARFIQNPLIEILNLWNDNWKNNILLEVNFHEMQ